MNLRNFLPGARGRARRRRAADLLLELAKAPARVPAIAPPVVVATLTASTAAVVVVGTATAATASASATTTSPCAVSAKLIPSCGALMGVSTETPPNQSWAQAVTAREKQIGRPADVLHNYHLWGTPFPSAAESAAAAGGQKLLYSWIGKRQDGTTVSWSKIASGAEDAVVDAEATRVAAMHTPVFVNFQNEPESSIGTSGTPAEYVAAWRHIHDRFDAAGATNAVWTVVFMGVTSSNKLAQVKALYPGDAYVDWIAWDPYNWGACRNQAWQSFADTVKPFYSWLMSNGYGSKPFMLAEYGTAEDPADPAAKPAWFTGENQSLARGDFPNLKVLSYFDHPAPPASCNWSIDTSPAALASYSALVKNLGILTTSVTRPGAPTAVTAAPSSLSAIVGWTTPKTTGGTLTGYRVTASPGGKSVTVAASGVNTAEVTGLAADTSYTFTVAAINRAGIGAASRPSVSVKPTAAGVRVPAPTAPGWQLNGSANVVGTTLQLTDATTKFSRGSAFWAKPIASASSFVVSFDEVSFGGTGADGLTLAFADAAAGATPTSLGASGGGLGWSGTPGFAVALDTYANGSDPSSNFVGLATGVSRADTHNLTWKATSNSAPSLRTLRHIKVIVAKGVITVSVDGGPVLRSTVRLPARTLIGFTSGDGNRTDRHTVSRVSISTR